MVNRSSNPKRERKSCAVSEYLFLTKMTRQIPGCCYDNDGLWNAINKCTVELISESKKARAERMVRECQTEEEILLDQFIDSLYNNGKRFANSTDGTSASDTVDLTESNTNGESNDENANFCEEDTFKLDPATLAQELDLNENKAEEDELRNVEIEDDPNNFEIKSLGNVKKCTVNPIAINQDVIAYGKIEMNKLNLETVHVHQRARQNRYKKISAVVVRDIAYHNEMNDNETSFMEESLKRNMDTIILNGNDN